MKASQFLLLMLAAGPYWVAADSLPGPEVTRVAVSTAANACWWVGIIEHGYQMPLTDGYKADMSGDTYGNQSQPLLLSSQGDVIWSDDAFAIQLSQSCLTVETKGGRLR